MFKNYLRAALLLSTVSIGMAFNHSYAQNTVVLENSTSSVAIESVTTEPQLIPVQLVKDPVSNTTTAKLAEVQNAGVGIGLNRLMLEGTVFEKETDTGQKETSIVWSIASMVDDETGEKKTTPFGIPFTSKVIVNPELEGGDTFNAQGDPVELMLAYQRLTQQDTEADEEEEEKEDTTDDDTETSSSGGTTSEDTENRDYASPTFEEAAASTYSTESCGVRVDIAQMKAILQEQIYIDGVAEGGCEDTLTQYALSKEYNSCSLIFDNENMVAYPQYRLVYTDGNDGEVQAQGCTEDEDSPITLVENYDACGIRHDFANGVSYAQYAITYTYNGVEQTLQSCEDSDVTYNHTVTTNSCAPIVADSTVTFQEQTIITVDDVVQTILSCQPNPETTTSIEEEVCNSPKYTHDYDAGQSYLNKSYYYLDQDENKVYVQTCVASDVTYEHEEDETQCSVTNDDTNLQSTINAKTYIEVDGSPYYLTACHALSPTAPYVLLENRWLINSSNQTTLTPQGPDTTYYSNQGVGNYQIQDGGDWLFRDVSAGTYCLTNTFYTSGNMPACWERVSGSMWSFTGLRYCITGELKQNWVLSSNIVISKTQSTEEPTITDSFSLSGDYYASPLWGYQRYMCRENPCHVQFSCQTPTCLHTHLKAHPVYQRGDLSEYMHTSTTVDNLHVCGNGSNLDGTTAD
jgi:hypothetical protein